MNTYFPDLSFGANYLGNLRSVGIKAAYRFFNDKAYVEYTIKQA